MREPRKRCIERAAVNKQEGKRFPNPNVLLEMGYAAALMGWGRVICVMNEHFGPRQSLPFDVRNRRFPINYSLTSGSSKEQRVSVKKDLTRWLTKAIQTVLDNEYETVNQAIRRLDVNCFNVMLKYRDHECFCEPNAASRTFGGDLDTDRFTNAVSRLLDLNLIEVRPEAKDDKLHYGYCWTYLGVKALEKLRFRAPAQPKGPPGPSSGDK